MTSHLWLGMKIYSISNKNTLNGIEIDSMLDSNKFYELVYNEDQNKFIAEEVRN